MTFQPSPAYDTIFPKTKKAHGAKFLKLCGLRPVSCTGFRLSPRELLRRHASMDLDIIAVIFLSPVTLPIRPAMPSFRLLPEPAGASRHGTLRIWYPVSASDTLSPSQISCFRLSSEMISRCWSPFCRLYRICSSGSGR